MQTPVGVMQTSYKEQSSVDLTGTRQGTVSRGKLFPFCILSLTYLQLQDDHYSGSTAVLSVALI